MRIQIIVQIKIMAQKRNIRLATNKICFLLKRWLKIAMLF